MSVQPQFVEYTYQSPEGPLQGSYVLWESDSRPRPLLLCVHGLTRNARDFDWLASRLTEHYRVVCMDVVGRGDSAWLSNPLTYGYPLYVSQATQLLTQLMARYQVAEVDWVGTSMGGLIGMMIAAQPVQPIRKLVMNDVGYLIPKASLQRLASYVGKKTEFPSLEAVEKQLRAVADSFGPLTDEQWRHLAETGSERHGSGYRLRYDPAIANVFVDPDVIEDVDLSAIWQAVATPVLLIRGGQSDLLLRQTAQAMAQQDNVTLVEFPGIGHAPALMARDQITAIREFLLA